MRRNTISILLIVLAMAGVLIAVAIGAGRWENKKAGTAVPPQEESLAGKVRNSSIDFQTQSSEAIKTKDFSQCEKISDPTYRAVCVNNIALLLAKETGDISYCQKIDDKLVPKRECEQDAVFLGSLEKEDVRICQQASDLGLRSQCENDFYYRLALKKNDIQICGEAPDQSRKDDCVNRYLVKKEFIGNEKKFDCQKFQGEAARGDCRKVKSNLNENILPPALCLETASGLSTGLFFSYCPAGIE